MKRFAMILTCVFVVLFFAGGLCPPDAGAWGRGHFYVIGTGPAGPELATLQALNTIERMDVIITAKDRQQKLFARYIGDTPVLFEPWEGLFDYKGKSWRTLNREEVAKFKVERFRLRDERVDKIKALLAQGKDVGLLDSGNPNLFGPGHWYTEAFDPQDVIVIPGMGCDAAAMAALGKSTIPAHDTRFVMQTAPFFLTNWGEDSRILTELSLHQSTLILYMALGDSETLFADLGKVLPGDMPCAVVFWAGYPDRERIVRGTIADMGQKLVNDPERYMGLLFIGHFLEGKPYERAMKLGELKLGAGGVK